MVWIIIAAVVVLLVIIIIGMYNSFVKLTAKADEAFATMDVYLKKRYDMIPNLVECVKGYCAHEKETLQNVIEARNQAISSKTPDEAAVNEKGVSAALSKLFALAESYPNLKADTQFTSLQGSIKDVENDIAESRKYYNAVIKQLNEKIRMFPSNIIAGMFHFQPRTYFEVESEAERQNVQVKF